MYECARTQKSAGHERNGIGSKHRMMFPLRNDHTTPIGIILAVNGFDDCCSTDIRSRTYGITIVVADCHKSTDTMSYEFSQDRFVALK